MTCGAECRSLSLVSRGREGREAGYTLVALLAVMTVLALFAMAAAPSIHQQAQREREIESIFRGEQVAEAIRRFYSYQQRRGMNGDAALPTSIDQLLEGLRDKT
jgi:type II secretory pathway pseudopilin PulG